MTSKYDLILFDLDGTLSDSNPGVKASLIYTMNTMGYAVPEQINAPHLYMGPPLVDTLLGMCGIPETRLHEAVEIYKNKYNHDGKFSNRCFNGTKEVLEKLKNSGARLAVATTKYEPFACEVLEILGIEKFFDTVCGTTADGLVKDKKQVIRLAFERLAVPKDGKAVLIGDSIYDVKGAQDAGIEFIGVSYGYGLQQDMQALGAESFADTPADLIKFLLE